MTTAATVARTPKLQAPFPWFGGKSRVASIVWERFGDTPNYVEPFFGSGAVMLGRPSEPKTETINDKDGYVANFWRALKSDPEQVAHYADWPVNENDLHARHVWLVNQKAEFARRLEGDPDFCDAKIAGYWVWGLCAWIGGNWCDGSGKWNSVDGLLTDAGTGNGVRRQRPHIGDHGQGVHKLGVHRKRPHLGDHGQGVHKSTQRGGLLDWMQRLSDRLRYVRVCCGDWARVCGTSPTDRLGLTGVFLDPPYTAQAGRDERLYATDCLNVGHDVCAWAIENGDNPKLRIAVCGYEGEYQFPESWECVPWKAHGGMAHIGNGNGKANRHRERLWFSPHCLRASESSLWDEGGR